MDADGRIAGSTKAEWAATLAHMALRKRIERTSLTVGEAAQAQKGPWTAATAERNERIVRRQIDRLPRPAVRSSGAVKLRDLTSDLVAAWSTAN